LQSRRQSSNVLRRLLKEDGLDATGAGGSDMAFDVIEEEHLRWLYTQALPGQFKDAPIISGWLFQTSLVGLLPGSTEHIAIKK